MRVKKQVAVLGGDKRQFFLAELLQADGWEVVTWGLEKYGGDPGVSLNTAVGCEMLILPLPICRGGQLNLPLSDTVLRWEELRRKIGREQMLFGGMVASVGETGDLPQIYDYYDREEVQIANAVPTAEGAIMRAMEETERTLYGSRCLILGFGRIGKMLAYRLHMLGARVAVAARKRADRAWIEAYGYQALEPECIGDELGEYDLIFNTIPYRVLRTEDLSGIRKDCILMELASNPGGFDVEAVKEFGLRAIVERGFPGIVAAKTAAVTIRDAIYDILKERGELR